MTHTITTTPVGTSGTAAPTIPGVRRIAGFALGATLGVAATLGLVRVVDGDSGAAVDQRPAPTADVAEYDKTALAVYARANGLSGLSPASLGIVASEGTEVDVAAYARANQLTGLSPASLGQVTERP